MGYADRVMLTHCLSHRGATLVGVLPFWLRRNGSKACACPSFVSETTSEVKGSSEPLIWVDSVGLEGVFGLECTEAIEVSMTSN